MKLYDTSLHWRLDRAVRKAIRADPQLRKEHRRLQKSSSQIKLPVNDGRVPYLVFIFIFAMSAPSVLRQAPGMWLFLLSVVSTCISFAWAGYLLAQLGNSPQTRAMMHMPVADGILPVWLCRNLRPYFLYPTLVSLIFYIVQAMGSSMSGWPLLLGAPSFALLNGLGTMALAVVLVSALPGRNWTGLGCLFFLLLAPIVFLGGYIPQGMSNYALLLFPTGWTSVAYQEGFLMENHWVLLAALPQLLLMCFSGIALQTAARQFHLNPEAVLKIGSAEATREAQLDKSLGTTASPGEPELATEQLRAEREADRVALRAVRTAEEEAAIRAFRLEPILDWRKISLIGYVIEKCLTLREKNIFELLRGSEAKASWRWFAVLNLIALAVAWQFPSGNGLLYGGGFLVLFCILLSSGDLKGLAALQSGAQTMPIFAAYPIDIAEIHGLTVKLSAFRLLLWVPCLTGMVAISCWQGGLFAGDIGAGEIFLAKALFCVLCCSQLLTSLMLSSGNNRDIEVSWSTLLWLVVVAPLLGLMLTCGVLIFLPGSTYLVIGLCGLPMFSWLFYRFGLWHHRRHADLVGTAKAT